MILLNRTGPQIVGWDDPSLDLTLATSSLFGFRQAVPLSLSHPICIMSHNSTLQVVSLHQCGICEVV